MQGGKQIPVGGGIWSFYVDGKPVWVKYNAVNEGKKDLPATADALRLWIDHGRDVKDGTYGYVVYAGKRQADLTG